MADLKILRLFPICFCLLAGCAQEEKPKQPELLSLEQVPERVMKAAREKLPDVRFDSAWKAKEQGREVYEVRGKTSSGKVFEVEVTPDGEVVGVE